MLECGGFSLSSITIVKARPYMNHHRSISGHSQTDTFPTLKFFAKQDTPTELPYEMTSSSAVKRAIGILSIGDMGMGVAKLLKAHDYMVYTVATGRRFVERP